MTQTDNQQGAAPATAAEVVQQWREADYDWSSYAALELLITAYAERVAAARVAEVGQARLTAERDRYRAALEHYADAGNWSGFEESGCADRYDAPGDGFGAARAALAAPCASASA